MSISRYDGPTARDSFDPVPVRQLSAWNLNVGKQSSQSASII